MRISHGVIAVDPKVFLFAYPVTFHKGSGVFQRSPAPSFCVRPSLSKIVHLFIGRDAAMTRAPNKVQLMTRNIPSRE